MIRKALFGVCIILFLFGYDNLFAVTSKGSVVPRIEASIKTGQSYQISFKDLEDQMTALTRSAEVEDSWIYVVEDETLYDVGIENQAHSVGTDLSKLESGEIKIRGKHVVDIHIHAWKEHNARDFLPTSTPDLHMKAGHADPVYKKFGAVGVRTLVYDGHGVWETTLSARLEKALASCSEGEEKKAIVRKINSFRENLRGNPKEEREHVVARYVADCESVGLEMTYKSLE